MNGGSTLWKRRSRFIIVLLLVIAVSCGPETHSPLPDPPQDAPPATPTGLTAAAGDGHVTLSWNANKEANLKGYYLYWGSTSGSLTEHHFIAKPATSHTVSGLSNGTSYRFAIEAETTLGKKSPKSAEVPAVPTAEEQPGLPPLPATPSGLTATPGDEQVLLSWNANGESNLKGYNLHWGTTSDNLTSSHFVAKPSTSFMVTGLSNGTTYFFAVDAENSTANKSAKSVAVSATPVAGGGGGADERMAVTSYIYSLTDSAPVSAPEHKELVERQRQHNEEKDGLEYGCTTRHFSLTENFEEIVALNPNADVLWAGSLVQGMTVPDGTPAPIPLTRGPITITATTGDTTLGTRTIDNPSLATVSQALNDIRQNFSGNTVVSAFYNEKEGHSLTQGMMQLGISAKWLTGSVKASLDLDVTSEKNTLYIKYVQAYYTVSVNPLRPETAFATGVKLDDVKRYTSPANLPAYIASVTYGRMLLIKMTSERSHSEMKAAVEYAHKGGTSLDASARARLEKTLQESEVNIVLLGGSSEQIPEIITNKGAGTVLKSYLASQVTLSRDVPAYPISYKIVYLKDNTIAKVGLATEYTIRECSPNYQDIEVILDEIYAGETEDCDGLLNNDAELYYKFELEYPIYTNHQGTYRTDTLIERPSSNYIRVGKGTRAHLGSTKRFTMLKKRGEWFRVFGQAKDVDDTSKDDLIGEFSRTYYHPFSTLPFTHKMEMNRKCWVELRGRIRIVP